MMMGRLANLKNGSNQHEKKVEGSGEPSTITTQQAADMGDIGAATVKRAKAVLSKGSQELAEAVDRGQVSVKKAASVVNLPKDQQLEAAKSKESIQKPETKKEVKRLDTAGRCVCRYSASPDL